MHSFKSFKHFLKGKKRPVSKRIGGLQSRPTKYLKQVVSRHFKGSMSVSMLNQMVDFVKNFKAVSLDIDSVKKLYSARTAEDVVHSKKVIVFEGAVYGALPVRGCVDYSVALIGLLRAKAVPCEMLRYKNHSTVLVNLHGHKYWIDLNAEKESSKIIDLDESPAPARLLKRILKSRHHGKAQDAWEMGITSLDYFHKY